MFKGEFSVFFLKAWLHSWATRLKWVFGGKFTFRALYCLMDRNTSINFYSVASTLFSPFGFEVKPSYSCRFYRSSSSSGNRSSTVSTPLSSQESRETKQQVIAALSAPQRTVEKLLELVQSSNERIEELTDKVKALDSDVKLLSRSDIMLRKLISQSMVVAVE